MISIYHLSVFFRLQAEKCLCRLPERLRRRFWKNARAVSEIPKQEIPQCCTPAQPDNQSNRRRAPRPDSNRDRRKRRERESEPSTAAEPDAEFHAATAFSAGTARWRRTGKSFPAEPGTPAARSPSRSPSSTTADSQDTARVRKPQMR